MYRFVLMLLMLGGCSGTNSGIDQPKTYKPGSTDNKIWKEGTVGAHWEKQDQQKRGIFK